MKLGKFLFYLLVFGFAVAVAMNTAKNGSDFFVYWRTAKYFFDGGPVYSSARDGIMTFKYPPWILPLFLPFGVLSLSTAKLIWGVLEAAALIFMVVWLQRRVNLCVLAVCFIAFSGIWTVHAFDGQVSLPLAACTLALFDVFKNNLRNGKGLLLAYLLSIKIFTLFPFVGFKWKKGDVMWIGTLISLLTLCSLPAIFVHHGDLSALLTQYKIATGPGIDAVGNAQITILGDQAQGFASLVFRVAHLDYRNQFLIILCCVLLMVCLGLFWRLKASKLPSDIQWAGWLALTATLQPLAGFHTFALAFPVAALSLDFSIKMKSISYTFMSTVGILMIAAINRKTLGGIGEALQFISIKSWGALLCCTLLVTPSCKKTFIK